MNPWRSVWGRPLDDPGGLAIRRTIRRPRVGRDAAVVAVQDRAFEPFADDEVDRPSGPRGERHHDGLAAFAQHGQCPVAAFEGEIFDAGTDRFGHPQPVEREQRDQRVIAGAGESGGDEHGAEFVAVQADGVGLVVQLWSADMHRR